MHECLFDFLSCIVSFCDGVIIFFKEIDKDQVITWLLLILGWTYVHYLSAKRDRQKEWREFSRETTKYVDELEKMATEYHANFNRDRQLEGNIKARLDYIDLRLSLVAKYLKIKTDIRDLRNACTLRNFESQSFTHQTKESVIIKDISFFANNLRIALYEAE